VLTTPFQSSGFHLVVHHGYRHISGHINVVADALSQVEAITAPVTHEAFAAAQEGDDEMRTILASTTALQLERILLPGTSVELYSDTSSSKPRP